MSLQAFDDCKLLTICLGHAMQGSAPYACSACMPYFFLWFPSKSFHASQHIFLCFPACLFVILNMSLCASPACFFLWFPTCFFLIPSMSVCSCLAWTATSASCTCCLMKKKKFTCFGQSTSLIAFCMKLLTPTGCRNTRGHVCCIATAACNAVQQLAGQCMQPWLALNAQHMCITCAPHVACKRQLCAADDAARHQP